MRDACMHERRSVQKRTRWRFPSLNVFKLARADKKMTSSDDALEMHQKCIQTASHSCIQLTPKDTIEKKWREYKYPEACATQNLLFYTNTYILFSIKYK